MRVAATQILADSPGDWNHMNGWGGAWMWVWGTLMMIAFVAVIVWLVRTAAAPGQTQRDTGDRAREILGERYARGELSTEEYRERIKELR